MIDIHIHPYHASVSKKSIVAFLDRYRVDKAWLLSTEATPDDALSEDDSLAPCILNSEVWDLYRDDPDRFVPCFSLPPAIPHVQERIERYARMGFRVFGELKVSAEDFCSPGCERIFEILEEKGLPILFHVGRSGFSEAQLSVFEKMFRKYARLTFIAHSMGWWKYISADWQKDLDNDYPFSTITPGGPAERLLHEYPNLFANFDMVEGVNAMARDPGFAEGFLMKYQERLLYGSDYPCEVKWPPFFDRYLRWRDCVLLGVPTPEELGRRYPGYGEVARFFREDQSLQQNIFHRNAERMLESEVLQSVRAKPQEG